MNTARELTPGQERNLYHYIIENYKNDKTITPLFFKNKEIRLVFEKAHDYIIKYGSEPSMDDLYSFVTTNNPQEFKKSLFLTIVDKERYYDEMEFSEKFLTEIFETHIVYMRAKYKVTGDIEKLRDGVIPDDIYNEIEEVEKINPLTTTPLMPEDIFNKMPEYIKLTSNNFSGRVRDMFLTNQFSVLSSLFPTVSANYGNRKIYSNLFSFVSTTQSGGKGHLLSNKHMIEKIEDDFEEMNNTEEIKLNKRFNLPADASTAELINLLNRNEGVGLIHDTEADTITQNQSQDWGDYSSICRKTFHHEPIEVARVDKFIKIREPKISIALTGTPSQIMSFIKNPEDGLISRFLYYVYTEKSVWVSQKPTMKKTFNEIFKEEYGYKLLNIYNFYKNIDTGFVLTDKQWDLFDEFFNHHMIRAQNNDKNDDLIKRQGLMAFRIMMILTLMRNFDMKYSLFNNKHNGDDLVCSDEDFNIAIEMIEVYITHSEIIYENIEKVAPVKEFIKSDKEKLYIGMKETFTRANLLELSKELKISTPTVDRLIKIWKENNRIELKNRTYKKLKD